MIGSSDQEVRNLEQQDPSTFDEMSLKRRWSSVCKDPEIGIKDAKTLAPWPIVNHMSPHQVHSIVTKKILKLDQASCKHILECMLEEKREDESKHAMQMADRDRLLHRLKNKHQSSLMLE